MPGQVPYDQETRAAVERLGIVLLASLRADDTPRHTKDKSKSSQRRRHEDSASRRWRALLGIASKDWLDRSLILAAFKQKAKKHHPDGGGDPDVFRDIVEARDRLLEQAGDR